MAFPAGSARSLPALEEHPADPVVERILLASDGGDAGAGALRWVERRAAMHRLDVTVLTVAEERGTSSEQGRERLRTAARHVAASAARDLERTVPSVEVTARAASGDPRAVVEKESASFDLLVVGTHRTGRLSGMLGSSFPMKLVEGAHCPVVVVPTSWTPGPGGIVVGMQGDASDEAAVAFAAHEALVLRRELRVVHAWYLPTILEAGAAVQTAEREVADSQDAVLTRALDGLRAAHPPLSVSGVLVKGDAAEALSREAGGQQLLVVGSHGWTVMDRFFLGSVSREVLARPVCPIAVVRPRPPATSASA